MKTTSRKTRTTTRIGARAVVRRVVLALAVAGLLPAIAEKKEEKKASASVIAGTVFREPGFSLPGAEVVLTEIRTDGKKAKPQRVVVDGRGEYAFRLPAREAKFRLRASAKGLLSEEKEAATTPGVRTEVFFTLKPAAK